MNGIQALRSPAPVRRPEPAERAQDQRTSPGDTIRDRRYRLLFAALPDTRLLDPIKNEKSLVRNSGSRRPRRCAP